MLLSTYTREQSDDEISKWIKKLTDIIISCWMLLIVMISVNVRCCVSNANDNSSNNIGSYIHHTTKRNLSTNHSTHNHGIPLALGENGEVYDRETSSNNGNNADRGTDNKCLSLASSNNRHRGYHYYSWRNSHHCNDNSSNNVNNDQWRS